MTRSLGSLGHVGRWMDRHGVDAGELDTDLLDAFLADHVDRYGHRPSAGVMPLLDYLRSAGVAAAEPTRRCSPLDEFLREYREWMAVERALSPDTVLGYTRLAHRFLAERVTAADELGAEGLTGADVTGFLLRESTRVRAGSVCCHANQLRQLLRYLSMRGFADPGLAEAVPSVGRWREAGVPQFPERPAIERMLESCDRSRRVGVRDFAILMLLARLGLRAVEVSRVELDDLCWRVGEIEIDGKGHERVRLPLPGDVGEALVAYLRLRRRSESRRVFLSEHAPTRPIGPPGVRSVVRDACRRAGIENVAAHRLRHALASQLLREGASLVDISQVLRHKHLESTAIYAKERSNPAASGSRIMAGSGTMTRFVGHVEDYLRLRRSLGYKLHDHARLLRRFAARLDAIGADCVTVELALSWALEPMVPPGSVVPWMRLLVVRGFARYMAGIDPRTEIPPTGLIRFRQQRRPPFIYSDGEILALMAQARDGIRQALCAATYETLIGLLAATGMRISEAIKLDRTDVDWVEGMLLVRESKFNKSRYVPLHTTTVEALERYARRRDELCPDPRDASFFVSLRRARLDTGAAQATFRRLCQNAGVGADAPLPPRFHDLRHTKAVNTLLCWYRDGVDVQSRLPALAASLEWDELDEPVIAAFLDHLETERHNSARTRNLRLTAIRSLFSYAAVRHPEHAAVFGRVLSIPPKRFQRRAVTFLTAEECDAMIDAPPQDRWEGRRDRAMLTLTIQAGLRVSELVQVNRADVTLDTGGSVRVEGKGRKHRAVPLTKEAKAVLAVWVAERGGRPEDPLFPTRTGRRLSRDAVERRVTTHVATAANRCPSLNGKRVHPHVLRHSCAMALLQAGVDSAVIALWLGHADIRSTQPYIHADMTIKERALALVAPASVKPGRYTPGDEVLAFLESLG